MPEPTRWIVWDSFGTEAAAKMQFKQFQGALADSWLGQVRCRLIGVAWCIEVTEALYDRLKSEEPNG